MRSQRTYANLVGLGNTLGNADNEANLVLDSFNDSVGGGGGRNVENGRIGLGLPNGLTIPTQVSSRFLVESSDKEGVPLLLNRR